MHLGEVEGEVADGLRQGLHPDGLVVREAVVLRLHPRVVDEGAGVGHEPRHGRADVRVHLHDLLHTALGWDGLVWFGLVNIERCRVSPMGADQSIHESVILSTQTYLEGSSSGELMRFSTARMTPSFVHTPTAVEPSCSACSFDPGTVRNGLEQINASIPCQCSP